MRSSLVLRFPRIGSAMEVSALRENLDLRVHDRVALDEIELYAEVLSAVAASDGRLTAEELDEVLGVRPEYLAASWQAIDETYGSLDSYLRDAGVTAAHIDQLRGALLS